MKRDRCTVIGIDIDDKNEIDDKNFSTVSKVSLNQHFLIGKLSSVYFVLLYWYPTADVFQGSVQIFKGYLPDRIHVWLVMVDFQISTYDSKAYTELCETSKI